MDNILITGASGFVGSHFVKKFFKKYNFFPIVRKKTNCENILKFVPSENIIIFDEKSILDKLREYPCDILIHLATNSKMDIQFEDVKTILEENVLFSCQMFDAFVRTGGKKILNIGTWWQYYPTNSLYTATKQSCEHFVEYYATQHDVKYLTIKLFDTYGASDPRPKIFNLILDAAKKRKSLDTTKGDQLINLTHVDDICIGLSQAIDLFQEGTAINKSYFLKHPETWRLKEAIEIFIKIHKIQVDINWGKRQYSPRDYFGIPDNIPILPSWNPRLTLREGLARIRV